MYLNAERCASCGGKFDDTYSTEPYNTALNPYRTGPGPHPFFCSERCKGNAIDFKDIVKRHDDAFEDFQAGVYRLARDIDNRDIDRTNAEVWKIADELGADLNRAREQHDAELQAEITRAYTQYFSEYARLSRERSDTLITNIEISDTHRYSHSIIIGGTGAGKTTLMQRDIIDLLNRPNPPGIIVIDPKGSMCRRLLSLHALYMNFHRVIYIDATDPKLLPPSNLFAPLSSHHPEKVRQSVETQTIDLMSYIFASGNFELTEKQSVGLSFVTRLLFRTPGANLTSMLNMLGMTSGQFHKSEFAAPLKTMDDASRIFFSTDFFGEFKETKSQLRARLFMIMRSPELCAMFDAPHRSIDWINAVQKRSIVLVNTGGSQVGETASQLIGRYVIASLTAATAGRYALPEKEWHPTFLFVDEANLFVDPHKTEKILSLSRETNLGVTMAAQLLTSSSMTDTIRAAISTNTGIKYAAGVEGRDLAIMAADMRCDPEFIRAQSVTDTHVHFAGFVRNHAHTKPFVATAMKGNTKHERQMTAEQSAQFRSWLESHFRQPLPKPTPEPMPVAEDDPFSF